MLEVLMALPDMAGRSKTSTSHRKLPVTSQFLLEALEPEWETLVRGISNYNFAFEQEGTVLRDGCKESPAQKRHDTPWRGIIYFTVTAEYWSEARASTGVSKDMEMENSL